VVAGDILSFHLTTNNGTVLGSEARLTALLAEALLRVDELLAARLAEHGHTATSSAGSVRRLR